MIVTRGSGKPSFRRKFFGVLIKLRSYRVARGVLDLRVSPRTAESTRIEEHASGGVEGRMRVTLRRSR